MELASYEPVVPLQFDDLDEFRPGKDAGDHEPVLSHHILILAVEFISVAVPLVYEFLFVRLVGLRFLLYPAGNPAEAHRSAHLCYPLLLFQEAYHGMRGILIELRGIRLIEAADIPHEFYSRALHA